MRKTFVITLLATLLVSLIVSCKKKDEPKEKIPTLSNTLPIEVLRTETITLTGSEYEAVNEMSIKIGGVEAQISATTDTTAVIIIPDLLDDGVYEMEITTKDRNHATFQNAIEIVTWKRFADFPGSLRASAAAFSVGNKGYVGTGAYNGTPMKDFWEYDAVRDEWRRIADFPVSLVNTTGFSIGNYGYVTMGKDYVRSLRRYDQENDEWVSLTSSIGNGSTMKAPAFVIGNKAYVTEQFDLYEYTPSTDSWSQKESVDEDGYFGSGAAFSINGKGYFGIGWIHETSSNINVFYEYNPGDDSWTKKADFPGTSRNSTTFFSLPNGKGYVGMGYDISTATYFKDMWEYDPVEDEWTQLDDYPGSVRSSASFFTIGSIAYVTVGYGGVWLDDLWGFSPFSE